MRRKAAWLTLLLVTVVAVAATAPIPLPNGWQGKLAAMLPVPNQTATLWERSVNVSLVELARRVATVGGDRVAYGNLLADVSQGNTPQYSESLGISREEFERYLVFQPTFVPTTKTLRLAVTRDNARVAFGDSPGLRGILKGFSVDLRSGDLTTPDGYVGKITAYKPNPRDRTLDVRSGFQWTFRGNNIDTLSGIAGTLNLWQLGSGQIMMVYTHNRMVRNVTSSAEVSFTYVR